MIKVNLYKPDEIRDESFKYAVITAKYGDKWVFCRHKERNTWEIPGGHREPGEKIEETARRELAEETGTMKAELLPAAAYGVVRESGETFGMLFFARIHSMGDLPQDSEIGETRLFDDMPGKLTYPEIQPHLYNFILGWLNEKEQEEKTMTKKSSISREQALELLRRYNKELFHIQHALTVEGVMRWYARELGYGEEEEFWGITGLLHDIDFELFPEEHCKKAPELLREAGVSEDMIYAVCSHGYGICSDEEPRLEMEKVLFAVDELTGLIWSCTLMRPSKSTMDMEVKSLKKKFKDKRFAAGCSRDIIAQGAERLGWELDELFDRTIQAMRSCEAAVAEETRFDSINISIHESMVEKILGAEQTARDKAFERLESLRRKDTHLDDDEELKRYREDKYGSAHIS